MKQHHIYLILFIFWLSGSSISQLWAKKTFKNPYVLVQNYTINDYHASCQNWDVYVSEHGALYVANNSGLLEFDGNTWHLYQTDDQESLFQIGMRNDTLFSRGERTNGFWRYNKEMIMKYTPVSETLPDSIFREFRMLAPFSIPEEIEKAQPQLYAGTSVYKFVTTDEGLFITDSIGNLLHHLSMNNSLQDNIIHDICVQDVDQIWLALDNGIAQVNINPPVSRLGKRSQIGKLEQVGSDEDYLYIKTNLGYFRKELGTQYSFTSIPQEEAEKYLRKQPDIITQPAENLFYEPASISYFNKAKYIYPVPENMYWLVKGNEAALFQNEFNTTTQKCRILFDNYQMNLTTRSPHFFLLNDSMYVVSAMQGALLVDIRQIMTQNMQPDDANVSFHPIQRFARDALSRSGYKHDHVATPVSRSESLCQYNCVYTESSILLFTRRNFNGLVGMAKRRENIFFPTTGRNLYIAYPKICYQRYISGNYSTNNSSSGLV